MRLTLLSDGSTDQALLPVLGWLVRTHATKPFDPRWADLRLLPRPPVKLNERVRAAIDLYPCDVLVVHRDAEREPPEKRHREIAEATYRLPMPVVVAVPVRMTEAWLLFDVPAIRRAAGCPAGTMPLNLPPTRNAESVPDPKAVLHEALRTASNLSGRRRKQFHPDIRRVADLIDDFAPLRRLPSFQSFEESFCNALMSLGLLRADPEPAASDD